MKIIWKPIQEYGQSATGYTDVLQGEINQKRFAVSINYLPQFHDRDQKVLTTLMLETPRQLWTEGTISDILAVCENRIKDIGSSKFKFLNKLDYMTIQILFVKSLEEFEFEKSGDFKFIND